MPAKKDQRMIQRDVRMTTSFKNQSTTLAHQGEQSLSELIRDIVVEFGNGPTTPAEPDTTTYTVARFAIDKDDYERAMTRAKAEGTNLSEAVRSGIEGRLAL